MQGTRIGATPVTHDVALPHLLKEGLLQTEMVVVRAVQGVVIPRDELHVREGGEQVVKALFFLVSPYADPGQHHRILARIATLVDADDFMQQWLAAENDHGLREILLRDDRLLSPVLKKKR